MKLTSEQANAITSAVWLVGIGTLLATGWWWPGILFLIGAGSVAQGFVEGRGWYSLQCGVWTLGFGIWALCSFNIGVLLILFALSGLFGAFFKPSPFGAKPKPDPSLDDGF